MAALRALAGSIVWMVAAVGVHAQTVELVVDVTATSRQLTSLDQQRIITQNDAQFQPRQFEWTIRFDLNDPQIGEVLPTGRGEEISAHTTFGGVDISPTAYTPELLAGKPAEQALIWSYSFAGSSVSTTPVAPLPPSPVRFPQYQTVIGYSSFVSASDWQFMGDGQAGITNHKLSLGLLMNGSAQPGYVIQPVTGADFLAYLQGQIGRKQAGAYSESVMEWLETDAPLTNSPPLGSVPDSVLKRDGVQISGDAVIRSVTVVPEPATYALMSLGLVGVASMVRRQRRA